MDLIEFSPHIYSVGRSIVITYFERLMCMQHCSTGVMSISPYSMEEAGSIRQAWLFILRESVVILRVSNHTTASIPAIQDPRPQSHSTNIPHP
jgi:hypothetical protein